MVSLQVQAPDGKTLSVDVPQGTDPKNYGTLADDALSHYNQVNSPAESSGMSFLRGIGNQIPLGSQFSALVSPGSYSKNMDAQNKAIAQDKAQHPIAYGAGAVTGTIGPALIPGVGEAMAANPLTTGATLGAANSISNTDIQKQPIEALKQAGEGAATGALLSGLLSKIMPSVSDSTNTMANNRANASVNMPKNVLINMEPQERQVLGETLREGGIVTPDKQEALKNATSLLDNYGEKIGEIASTSEKQGLTADPVQHYDAITDLLTKAGKFTGSENNINKALGRQYRAGAADLVNLGDNPTWSSIQDLKETYGATAFKPNGTQAQKDTYFALSNMLKGIADKAQSNPSLAPQYKEALAGYAQLSPVVSGLESSADADLRGAGGTGMAIHPMRMLASMPRSARITLGAIATAAGHPYVGIGGNLLAEGANPAVQSQVLGGISNALGSPTLQAIAEQGTTKLSSNPQTQNTINDLIDKLKAKYAQRQKM